MYFKEIFLVHLKEQRYAKGTIRDYSLVLNDFERYLAKRKIKDEKMITREIVLKFFQTFLNQEIITKHQRGKITRIVIYFKYLEEHQKIFLSPLRDYTPPRFYNSAYPTLKEQEINAILKKIRTDKPSYIQGIAIIELMYSSALRPREVYNLKLTDIDYTNKLLFIEQSKNKKDRIVPVGKKALYWLDRYIKDIRPLYLKGNNNYVFINQRTGKQLTCRGICFIIQKTLKENGLEKVKPYSLRSTTATALLINGMPIEYISKLLGHAELRTTQIYLKVKKHELGKILEKKHPRIVNSKSIEN